MTPSHHKGTQAGAAHNTAPAVVVQHRLSFFAVLHRNPQLTGEPEHAVCADNEAIALFFVEADAKAYARWRNIKARHEQARKPQLICSSLITPTIT
jgi:hypothetical protein